MTKADKQIINEAWKFKSYALELAEYSESAYYREYTDILTQLIQAQRKAKKQKKRFLHYVDIAEQLIHQLRRIQEYLNS